MLLRNTVYNLLGLGLPLVVAIFTIPLLIEALGTSNFGVLTLIWAVVSYFGLFDLGLGRTLTLQMARAIAEGQERRVGPMVATALVAMAGLGIVIGTAMALFAGAAVGFMEAVPDPQQTVWAVAAMAVAIPAITLTSGLRGILEARHAFGIVNLIRLPMGVFTFLGPMLVAVFLEPRLDWIAWALVGGRWVACLLHGWFAWKVLPQDHGRLRFDMAEIRPLLSIGGWLTVSNIVSPLMGYADRFIIAGLVSAAAVAYYATPYEIVTKLWIVPGALTAVLFPTFAAQMAKGAGAGATLFRQSVSAMALVLLPVCAALAIFAHELLSFWIDAEFAANSTILLQIFALGVLVNSTAHIPFTLIQSAGRPQWTAMIHLAEIVPFLGLLWWATATFGPVGAALAWLLRITLDTLAMFWASERILRLGWRAVTPSQLPGLAGLIVLASVVAFMNPLAWRAAGLLLVSLLAAVLLLREPSIRTRLGAFWPRFAA